MISRLPAALWWRRPAGSRQRDAGPASAYFHGVGLTLEKALLTLWSALCLAPLALAMQWLALPARWWHGTLLRLAVRIVVLATVVAGNALGVFGFPGTIAILVLLAALDDRGAAARGLLWTLAQRADRGRA